MEWPKQSPVQYSIFHSEQPMITITVPQKGTNIDSDINIKILEVWGPGLIAGFGPFRQASGQFDLVLAPLWRSGCVTLIMVIR